MVKTPKMSWIPSLSAVSAVSACYITAYLLMQYSGLFRPSPSGLFRVLHQWPALSGVGVLFVVSLYVLIKILVKSDKIKAAEKGLSISNALLHMSILGLSAGIFLSALTRFEGTITLTEGQESWVSKEVIGPDAIYSRLFSGMPDGKLDIQQVDPVVSSDGRNLKRIFALTKFSSQSQPVGRQFRLDSRFPKYIDGWFYQVGESGGSVLFRLLGESGNILDEAYAVLKIFPSGAEDAIRVMQIPHTIYLRYYHEASAVPDKNGVPSDKKGPLFKVRVARNLDLLVNTFVSPDEFVQIDGFLISFRDIRNWVDIRIVRDPGIYLIVPALLGLIVSGGFLAFADRRKYVNEKRHSINDA